MNPELTIIVPMKDEEAVVAETTRRLITAAETVAGDKWQILLVDDGSTDRTFAIASDLSAKDPRIQVCRHAKNFGRGRALRTGFAASRGKVVISVDADLSYDHYFAQDTSDDPIDWRTKKVEFEAYLKEIQGGRTPDQLYDPRLRITSGPGFKPIKREVIPPPP